MNALFSCVTRLITSHEIDSSPRDGRKDKWKRAAVTRQLLPSESVTLRYRADGRSALSSRRARLFDQHCTALIRIGIVFPVRSPWLVVLGIIILIERSESTRKQHRCPSLGLSRLTSSPVAYPFTRDALFLKTP